MGSEMCIRDSYIIYDYDFVVEDDGTVHLVWSSVKDSSDIRYDVFYQKSEDFGVSWEEEIQISNDDSDTNIGTRIDFSGNNVYVVWEQYNSSAAIYQTVFAKSTDSGDSFGNQDILSSTNSVSVVTVTAAGNNVVVGWVESNDNGDAIIKSRNSANSGDSFTTESVVGSAGGTSASYLEASNDGNTNYYFSWMELGNDQPRKIQCARSANSGSTWGNPVNVDGINNGNENEVRASPVISANNERVIVVWSETNDGSGASSDQDIVYSISTNDGQSWSCLLYTSPSPRDLSTSRMPSSA
mgnify:CR=1 FL=1